MTEEKNIASGNEKVEREIFCSIAYMKKKKKNHEENYPATVLRVSKE